ncbi:ABC transporter permease [Acuticoccus sediminis]|uniref:ABC transporter permease n=1 Tax=Acuticoccus sediminis TaxID=2184697 RepID=A0A8B2NI94_9HYPH|nr:ABC transporter permease [Acuticoccus sediminis]RAH97241.1 ABC transporter permease [Acuticoccus sediminis]
MRGVFTLGERQLSLPLAIFFGLFFVLPLALMTTLSFTDGTMPLTFSLTQYATFVSNAINLGILWDTIRLALLTTALCLVLGYPVALAYQRLSGWTRSLLMFAIIMPLLTSVVVRTFAWLVILGRNGIVNGALVDLGLAPAPLRLLYTEMSVVVALAQIQLPLMVLPLITALQQLPAGVEEASTSLGAGAWRTFLKVTLPMTLPGAVAGGLLVFAASATAFVTQSVIGGGRLIYMPQYIYQQAISLQNFAFAAAISVVFTLSVVGIMFAANLLAQSRAVEGAR